MKIKKYILIIIIVIIITSIQQNASSNNTAFKIGDYIEFGKYKDEPILWRVIKVDLDGNPLLFSDKIITIKAYDSSGEKHTNPDSQGVRNKGGSNLWQDSNLRQWMNSQEDRIIWKQSVPDSNGLAYGTKPYDLEKGFLANGNFTEDERSVIKPVLHKIMLSEYDLNLKEGGYEVFEELFSPMSGQSNNQNIAYYQMLTDKVFLLDFYQLKTFIYDNSDVFNKDFLNGEVTQNAYDEMTDVDKAMYQERKKWWCWCGLPFRGSAYSVGLVTGDDISPGTACIGYGVRPALMLYKEAIILSDGKGQKDDPYKIIKNVNYNQENHNTNTKKYILSTGDYIVFGKYQDEPILWRIIDSDFEMNPLLISDKILTLKAFDAAGDSHTNQDEYREKKGSNLWRDSNLRQWLNSSDKIINWLQSPPSANNLENSEYSYDKEKGFLADGNFTEEERNMLLKTQYKTALAKADENIKTSGVFDPHFFIFNIKEGALPDEYGLYQTLSDNVYILSMRELREFVYKQSSVLGDHYYSGQYTGKLKNQFRNIQYKDNIITTYSWMRLPMLDNSNGVQVICNKDYYNVNIAVSAASSCDIGVRPSLRLRYSKIKIAYGNGSEENPYIIDSGDGCPPVNLITISNSIKEKSAINDTNNTKGQKPSNWAVSELTKLYEKGLVPNDMKNGFQNNITREDFCRLCINCIEKITKVSITDYMREDDYSIIQPPFSDCNNYYVLCAKGLDLMTGYNNKVYPAQYITREEASVLLMKLGKMFFKCVVNENYNKKYIDDEYISLWSKKAVTYVSIFSDPTSNTPIMGGYKGSFNPKGFFTREQAYLTIYRLYNIAMYYIQEELNAS